MVIRTSRIPRNRSFGQVRGKVRFRPISGVASFRESGAVKEETKVPRVFALLAICIILSSCSSGTNGATTNVDGLDVYWSSRGDGPTVMFVHGGFVDSSFWDGQIDALSDRYRVIALDLPGHGLSEWPPDGNFSFDQFARAVDAVREAAGVDRMVLVGHSMGGYVIKKYEILFPDRVAGIVSVDTSLDTRGFRALASGGRRGGPPEPTEAGTRAQFVDETPPEVIEQVVYWMVTRYIDGSRPRPNYGTAFAEERDIQALGDQSIAALPSVDAPVLEVYGGERSNVAGRANVQESIPHAELETIPGTGHFLSMEKPAEFNRILRGFLESVDF
jgi:pimeloyl-ACP methyl ester carboxylesterase